MVLEDTPKLLKGRCELGGGSRTAEWILTEGQVGVHIVDFGLVEGFMVEGVSAEG